MQAVTRTSFMVRGAFDLGDDDLYANDSAGRGEPIPPNASLIFEAELVAFEPSDKITQRTNAPLTERFAFAAARKALGNEAFNAGLVSKAIVLYSQVRTRTRCIPNT